MIGRCRAPGCTRPVGGGQRGAHYGILCNAHRSHQRRHGDTRQRPITARDLKAPLRDIEKRMAPNHDGEPWVSIRGAWRDLVWDCETTVALYDQGRPMSRSHLQAARSIVAVAKAGLPDKDAPWKVVAALEMLRECEPHLFASDDGYWAQVARRFRALSDVHVAEYWDNATRRSRRVYRDLPAQATVVLGHMLSRAVGGVGLAIARADARRETERAERRRRIHQAFEDAPDGGGQ